MITQVKTAIGLVLVLSLSHTVLASCDDGSDDCRSGGSGAVIIVVVILVVCAKVACWVCICYNRQRRTQTIYIHRRRINRYERFGQTPSVVVSRPAPSHPPSPPQEIPDIASPPDSVVTKGFIGVEQDVPPYTVQ